MVKREVSGWQLLEREGIARLERVFHFPSFADALAITNRVAALAVAEGLSSAISASATRGESRRHATHRSADSVLIARTSPGAVRAGPGSHPRAQSAPAPTAATLHLRRAAVRRAVSCCRKARFSRASWRWPPHGVLA
jgi:4a-hydroxytetrahydrobiopterin dehydratase